MDRQGYDEKLARILRTAAAEIAERGFHNTGIRDISRATGISLAGLYHYFRSKDELLFLIQDHCFGTVLEKLERVLDGVQDPRERLRLLVENHLRFFAANMQEMKVLSHEAESLTGEYRTAVNAKKRHYTSIGMGIVQELAGEDDSGDGRSARAATFVLFGMLNWIYNWYDPERDLPVAELAEEMTDLFLRGWCRSGGAVRAGLAPRDGAPAEGPSIWRTRPQA